MNCVIVPRVPKMAMARTIMALAFLALTMSLMAPSMPRMT